ncbi:MAG TPA: ATP-dependent helicase [Acidimicrobiia bacterium]|nr:ATP-dependent helicase [Acidimicrobiia bacterium]
MDVEALAPELNGQQRRVVEHGDGPLLVVAGAGTGKTKTLAARVAVLLERGIRPERILLLTFSRRAAGEMLRRAAQVSDPAAARAVWGGTFHAIGHRLLRVHGAALGLGGGFSVLDQSDAAELMGLVRSEVGSDAHDRRLPRKDTLLAIYSRVVNTQRPLREVLDRAFPWCATDAETIGPLFTGYTERKRAQHLLDFDDLLLFWASAARHPDLGGRLAALFDHVLVDEYQDTNHVQAEIVRAMTRRARGVMVVGDDAQAIYGFRAATVRNILDFPSQYTGTTIVALEENYRSTPPILAVANGVIAQAAERHEKELWSRRPPGRRPRLVTCADEQAQADVVCTSVLAHYEEGVALRDQAVLFRAAHHSDLLEVELTRRGIPFVKYGGLRFLEAAHIKDLLALLRVLDNPYDELAWFRVLQLVDGIGPIAARRLLVTMGVRPRSGDARHPVERVLDAGPAVRPGARTELADLGAALAACADGDRIDPAAQVGRLRQFLEPVLRRRYDHPESRVQDLEELEHLAQAYANRGQLVAELVLDPPAATSDLAGPPSLDEDFLVLSTVHSAKGGEWDAVHVIHAADGMFPSDLATRDPEEIDEERRLFYVALTRARDHLHVYFPLRVFHRRVGGNDRHHYGQLTRFLPPAVHDLFERPAPDDRVSLPEAVLAGQSGPLTAELDEALAALWR